MPEGLSVITTEGPRFITMEEAKELFATKVDLANMETRIIKWTAGMMIGGITVAAAVVSVLIKLLDQLTRHPLPNGMHKS